MAERQYLGFHIINRTPSSIVEVISDQVRQYKLGTLIPRVCYERPKKKNQREFYLFLAVLNETIDEIPDEVQNLMNRLRLPAPSGRFVYDDIKTMTGPEFDIENYARQIEYRPPEIAQFDDPLSIYNTPSRSNIQSTAGYNQLLYWLSAIGSGGWEMFRGACRHLKIDETGNEARRIFRRLRLLGHAEYIADGSKWHVCPPCLVHVGTNIVDGYRYFLAGQRSPKLEQALEKLGNVEIMPQSEMGAPDCIYITFDSVQSARDAVTHITDIEKICELHLVDRVSKQLAALLPDIAGWQANLRPLGGILPELYTIERWQEGDYIRLAGQQFGPGLYRLTRFGIANFPPQYTLFYEPQRNQWLQGDWYGLRYLAIRQLNQECPALFLPKTFQLVIPSDYRWPDLYERALVLASGRLPHLSNHGYVFEQITSNLADELSHKLSATIQKENSNE